MIENNVNKKERLKMLNNTAKKQLDILINDKNIVGLGKHNNNNNSKLIGDKK